MFSGGIGAGIEIHSDMTYTQTIKSWNKFDILDNILAYCIQAIEGKL